MNRRLPALLGLLLLASAAFAGWTKDDRYGYLDQAKTRLLILGGKGRFILQRDAKGVWSLASGTGYAAWVANRGLPKDPGKLVAQMPKGAAIAGLHSIGMTNESPPTLVLDDGSRVALEQPEKSPNRYELKSLGALSPVIKDLGVTDIWAFRERMNKEPGFAKFDLTDWRPVFDQLLVKKNQFVSFPKGLLVLSLVPADQKVENGTTTAPPKKPVKGAPGTNWIPWAIAGGIVVLLAGLGFWKRDAIAGLFRKETRPTRAPEGRMKIVQTIGFKRLTTYLEQLTSEGARRPDWAPEDYQSEALIEILEAHRSFPKVRKENEELRRRLRDLEATEAGRERTRAEKAEATVGELREQQKGLKREIEQKVAVRNTLTKGLLTVRQAVSDARTRLGGSSLKMPDGQWKSLGDEAFPRFVEEVGSGVVEEINALADRAAGAEGRLTVASQFNEKFAGLARAVALACHAMLHERGSDTYSLAYAHLAQLSLAGLLRANAEGDRDAANGYLINLEAQRSATANAYPGMAMAMDLEKWRQALAVFGDPTPPPTEGEPHPHVTSLARTLKILIEGNPPLRDFKRIYVVGDRGIHRIEPPL